MSINASLYAYEDCFDLFDQALEASIGIRTLVSTDAEAYQLRTRLHYARTLSRKQAKEMYPNPASPEHGKSVYDDLVVSIKNQEGKWWIYIFRRKAPLVVEELPAEDLNETVENSKGPAA